MPMRRKTAGNELYQLTSVPMKDVLFYQSHEVGNPFVIQLKVPAEADKFNDDHKHFTKSNINVCYAAPRNANSPRDWYEAQLNVSSDVLKQKGYPLKGVPFYVVTDDGFGFVAHTTSANNKQFAAVGDELILGKWLKGRLVHEGLVAPVEDITKDVVRSGMITKEILDAYGCNSVAFQKTDQTIADPLSENIRYEVWTIKLINICEE